MHTRKIFWFIAACLCIVCITLFLLMRKKQPADPGHAQAPNIALNGTIYFQASHQIVFENCPDGFEYGGVVESGTAKGCAYYINQQIVSYKPYELQRDDDSSDTIDAKTAGTR